MSCFTICVGRRREYDGQGTIAGLHDRVVAGFNDDLSRRDGYNPLLPHSG